VNPLRQHLPGEPCDCGGECVFRDPPPGETPAERFARLEAIWRSETMMLSSIQRIVMHWAYQTIIGMGRDAVPLIFREMRAGRRSHWFWALAAITEHRPAEGEDTVKGATDKWLEWADANGYPA
jgi:hypothetical protein